MYAKFLDYFKRSSDENKLLVLVLLILSGLTLLLAIYDYSFYTSHLWIAALAFMAMTLSAVTLLYFQKISYDKSSYLIVVLMFILLLTAFILSENKVEATLYLLAFPVVLIALRPDNEWAISIFAFIVVMLVCQIFGWTKADYSWKEMTQIWLTLSIISSFLGFYVLMSRATKVQLSIEQAKLENINKSLELKVAARTKELQEANEKLSLDITIDPVTKIMNKRTFMERLRTQIERFKLDKTPYSIIILDLDNFYQINHSYGRKIGDEILAKVAVLLMKNSLSVDIVARIAGDEFAILMHGASYEKALERAETIRQYLEWAVFVDNFHLTASFGVIEFNKNDGVVDEHIVLHQLDMALQKAKHRGKNMICSK